MHTVGGQFNFVLSASDSPSEPEHAHATLTSFFKDSFRGSFRGYLDVGPRTILAPFDY